jgi:hypothetical protein
MLPHVVVTHSCWHCSAFLPVAATHSYLPTPQIEPMTPEEVVEREKDEAAARAASPAKGAKGGAGEKNGQIKDDGQGRGR